MIAFFILFFVAIGIPALTSLLNRDIIDQYSDACGEKGDYHTKWIHIVYFSVLGAIIAGLAFYVTSLYLYEFVYPPVLALAVTIGYATTQAFFTDPLAHVVDRSMLYICMIISGATTVYLLITEPVTTATVIKVVALMVLAIVVLLFVPDKYIGASDARGLFIILPPACLLFDFWGLLPLCAAMCLCAIHEQYLKKFGNYKGLPILHWIFLPYAIIFAFYPAIIILLENLIINMK